MQATESTVRALPGTDPDTLLSLVGTQGNCVEWAPHDWFVTGGDNYQALHNRGLLVCQGCPVQDACLDYADAVGESEGIWGGLELSRNNPVRAARMMSDPGPRRAQFRRRAARWLATRRFETRRGRRPTTTRSDRDLVEQLTGDVLADLDAGRVPPELVEEAHDWDEVGPGIVGAGDDLPEEFVEAVQAAWRQAS